MGVSTAKYNEVCRFMGVCKGKAVTAEERLTEVAIHLRRGNLGEAQAITDAWYDEVKTRQPFRDFPAGVLYLRQFARDLGYRVPVVIRRRKAS